MRLTRVHWHVSVSEKRVPPQRRPCSDRIRAFWPLSLPSTWECSKILSIYARRARHFCVGAWKLEIDFSARPNGFGMNEFKFCVSSSFLSTSIERFPTATRILTITWERIFQFSWIMDAEVTSSACQTHYSHRVLIWLFPASTIITIRCYAALNFAVPLISISQRMKWLGGSCIFYTRSFAAHSRRSSARPIVVKPCWFVNLKHALRAIHIFASFSRNYLRLWRYPSPLFANTFSSIYQTT